MALVLLWYDIVLTLPIEVERIWRRKITGATLVYFITRYAAYLERVFFMLVLFLTNVDDDVRLHSIFLRLTRRLIALQDLQNRLTHGRYSLLGVLHLFRWCAFCYSMDTPLSTTQIDGKRLL